MQALFSEVKHLIRAEVIEPLGDVKAKVEEADIELEELDLDHFIDRFVIYIVCAANMVLCSISIYLVLMVRRDIIRRIDEVRKKAGIRVEEHIPLLPQGGAGERSNIVITQEPPRGPLALPDNVMAQGIAPPSTRMLGHLGRR